MRENIGLYRGKRKDNGEWVEGCAMIPLPQFGGETCIIAQDAPFHSFCYEVIPETVGEYTGLPDKNGKKIFEGDIIRKGFECFVVKWNNNQCRWGLFDKHDFEVSGFNEYTKNYLEVIGNCIDNPELLQNTANC